MPQPPLPLDTLAQLLPDIDADRVWAVWVVTSAFGPESMESYRRVTFGVDDRPIAADCPVHRALEDALVAWLELPETSERERIDGEGGIGREGDWLTLDAMWTRGVPYDWGESFEKHGPFLKLPK